MNFVAKRWDPWALAKLKARPLVAVDPGSNGGLFYANAECVATCKLPESDEDIVSLIGSLRGDGEIVLAVEDVPKWCGSDQFERKTVTGASMAVLHGNYKLCVGAALALGYLVKKWKPIQWQHATGARSDGWKSSTPGWKNHLKDVAQSRLPEAKLTLATSDAVLIGLAEIYAKK